TGLGGQVQFLTGVTDEVLVRCYQQCDIFVLPCSQVGRDIEGFGMVLLEAQACGKPVLAGASGGTAEAVCHPETGFLMPFEDASEVAARVIPLLTNDGLRDEMGRAARQWVTAHYDWERLSGRARLLFASCDA